MTNRARFAIDITLWLLVLVGGGIVGGIAYLVLTSITF